MINADSLNLTDVQNLLILEGKQLFLLKKYGENFKTIIKANAYIGKNGFTNNKTEGDGKTPLGIFKISYSFGLSKRPDTNLKYIKANKNHYFISDPESIYYNKLVNIKKTAQDWNNAEKITDYKKEYSYVIVPDYNSKSEKGKGSAIFLHCKGSKDCTEGCIATNKKDMLLILKNIDENTYFVIAE